MNDEDIESMIDINVALFGVEMGVAMSIAQAVIISSYSKHKLNNRRND